MPVFNNEVAIEKKDKRKMALSSDRIAGLAREFSRCGLSILGRIWR
jgi:hypothetical protein